MIARSSVRLFSTTRPRLFPQAKQAHARPRQSRPKGGIPGGTLDRTWGFLHRWSYSRNFWWHVNILIIGGSLVYFWRADRVEFSNRKRFNVVSDELIQRMAVEQERRARAQYSGKILPELDPRSQLVTKVLERLKPYTLGMNDAEWSVHVIEDDAAADAFVLPGGKVFIFTGMLSMCENEDGVAALLGHEIGHIMAQHHAEKASRSVALNARRISGALLDVDASRSETGLKYAFERPGSLPQESEADYIGLLLMTKASYDPRAALRLWQRMQRAHQSNPVQYLATHPAHTMREKRAQRWLPMAVESYKSSAPGNTYTGFRY